MKFIYSAIAAYRNYSTKSTSKTSRLGQSTFKNKRNPSAITKWTDQQSQVLAAISSGQSVFVTGSAGSGKTVLVKHIIKILKEIHGKSRVFVTASTGVAACHLNGQTLHSFAGVGVARVDRETLLGRVFSDKWALKRWDKVGALVIDEISMVDGELFENLEYIAKVTRGEFTEVWSGIQLVVSGDFFQLPPIVDQCNSSGKQFAFEADCWNASFDLQVELTSIFRQSDTQLIKLLQGIRRGESDPDDLQLLKQCCSVSEPGTEVVQLYPRKQDVNIVNERRLKSLEEEIVVYKAVDSGKDPWKSQLKQGLAPEYLELCEGARVMLIYNINTSLKLVNGATGTIICFGKPEGMSVLDINDLGLLPIVKFDSGKVMMIEPETWDVMEGDRVFATRKQIPLVLAWAISIHKCQGMTLDSLHTDLSRAFGCGMVYVALSHVRSLDGLHLSGFHPYKIKAHPKVLQYYQCFASNQDTEDSDDGANKIQNSSRDLHVVTDETSNGGTKYLLSSSKFIYERRQDR